MKVTLVYPAIRNFGWNSLGKYTEACWVNHGLSSLAACLERNNHKVNLLDLREQTDWKSTAIWLNNNDALTYGISMATLDYHEAIQIASLIRTLKPKAEIIVGGPHPSICPQQVDELKVFNHIVTGEGEITFPKLVENPDAHSHLVVGERPNLDELPYEHREIFNMKKILRTQHPFFVQPFLNIISGRGCIYQCGFCKPGEDLIFGKFRMRSFEHFWGEVKLLNNKYDFKMLMVDDDSFTLYPDYTLKFCDNFEKLDKRFLCQSRADFIVNNPDVIRRMRDAGLFMVFIGLESGSQRMLDFMHKGTTIEQNYEAVRICHRLGIEVFANHIYGLPTETKEEMQATYNMIKTLKPKHVSPSIFTPIPGTHLYDYCKAHDLLITDDMAKLGTRAASSGAKIKGVDYKWINKHLPQGTRKYRIRKALRPLRPVKVLTMKAKETLFGANPVA